MDNRIKNIMKNMEFTTPATTEEINAAEKELGLKLQNTIHVMRMNCCKAGKHLLKR